MYLVHRFTNNHDIEKHHIWLFIKMITKAILIFFLLLSGEPEQEGQWRKYQVPLCDKVLR